MKSTELKQGHSYEFDVIKEQSNRKYFKLKTDDGVEFSLLKFKFQKNLPLPDSIKCYVKTLIPTPILGQDISLFINDFYNEGEEYDFIVKGSKQTDGQDLLQYELEDKNGLCFKLFNAPQSLSKGSRIKCKITKIKGASVTLKYEGTLSLTLPISFKNISDCLNMLGITRHHEIYLRMLSTIPEFHDALAKYTKHDPYWIFQLLQDCSIHITDWLIASKDDRKNLAKIYRRMYRARDLALYLLEGSDYLRACNHEQRTMLQDKLSTYVELFNQFGQATNKILSMTHEAFIDKMFACLKDAGYLYHPSKQFRIMMTILKLRPELINSRMGELFDALHNWEIINWQSDPFRPALVEQLQIFIEENCEQINLLPANDSSDDNKAIMRMIIAISIQRLLATDEDNIDLDINRAMLYRYISYLNSGKINILLNKAISALLGIETPNEFSWGDTDQPTLLIEKLSHPSHDNETKNIVVKTYSTSKADIRLFADGLHIIAKDADPDSTVLPNMLLDWLNPKISLSDADEVYNVRKSKDLKEYRKLWEDVCWSIFGGEQNKLEHYVKRLPFGGEEVRIIIDDIRIKKDAPQKQRLQFHCTIKDDLYYGDGWMPCDSYHMLGWLNDHDIPGNYDGSLDFTCDSDGNPLFYYANVYRKNGEFEFNMKSQIDNFLLDTIQQGQESITIVTFLDRANNAWLCLSELGCTFKVPVDETSLAMGLCEGKLVRVKYIEPEHSNNTTQFFIGEISENQDNIPFIIKKSVCLNNLMRNLGISTEEGTDKYEVMETEEVMSEEELHQLILMFQRRAFSETEYLKAFNYLGLASILCKLAEMPTLGNEISTHMELLMLLQDFGKNQNVDNTRLEVCEEKVQHNPMLERLYTRLKIVANIGTNENAASLWDMHTNPRNEIEEKLANLVLSYNMIPKALEGCKKEIMKEITTLLNVNNTTITSKYYGEESQTVEFKSSLIYSTRGGSKPDPKEQLYEITHIICGFMNSRGGDLYIGVNDSGYENGLADDIAYRRSHGQKATLDGMKVDLQNHLDRIMPSHAKDHWEVDSDPESTKGVIKVKVLPVEIPVELDGIIYVRSSSTTKPRLDEDRDEFIKNRHHNYQLITKKWGIGNEISPISESSENEHNISTFISDNFNAVSEQPSSQQIEHLNFEEDNYETDRKILTGKHRLNVLHEYDLNFATPCFYIYFVNDNKMFISRDDQYLEHDPSCNLALAINEKEKDGFILFTYSDGKVVKLHMSKVGSLMVMENTQYRTGVTLCHVNIANSDDYLLSVIKGANRGLFYRIDAISSLPEDFAINAEGYVVCDNTHEILRQEIISSAHLSFFNSDAINRERRYYGLSIPVGNGTLSEFERIEELLRPVAYPE
ncbi:MAG: ATP-binding protein [Bacteroides sp.]|nr:ATP-binding protein [Bacteroides sp.]